MHSNPQNQRDIINENLNIFKKIINLEISKGYENKAVVGGGLDGYMEINAQYFVQLIRNYQDKYGQKSFYSILDSSDREIFCNRLIQEIDLLLNDNKNEIKPTPKNKKIEKKLTLDSDIKSIGRVPSKVVNMFKQNQIHTLSDVLTFYPRRHRDFNDIKKVNDLSIFTIFIHCCTNTFFSSFC